jgi:hypothetical protein
MYNDLELKEIPFAITEISRYLMYVITASGYGSVRSANNKMVNQPNDSSRQSREPTV